jgi:hypothetical protein
MCSLLPYSAGRRAEFMPNPYAGPDPNSRAAERQGRDIDNRCGHCLTSTASTCTPSRPHVDVGTVEIEDDVATTKHGQS